MINLTSILECGGDKTQDPYSNKYSEDSQFSQLIRELCYKNKQT